MEIHELNNIKNLNELDLVYLIIEKSQNMLDDAENVIKGNKAAGIRIRHKLQDLKIITDQIRDKIQIRKGAVWGEKRKTSVDKAIERKNKEKKTCDRKIEKARQKRLEKLQGRNNV